MKKTIEEVEKKTFGEIWQTLTPEQSKYLKDYIDRQREDAKKYQSEQIGLLEIELSHTKTLLASCEKALEDRDKENLQMYSKDEVEDIVKNDSIEYVREEFKMIGEDRLEDRYNHFRRKNNITRNERRR